jgi:hypothetical protein
MTLDARPVDPRDQRWEVWDPRYRVYFWTDSMESDEWELARCDVKDALEWASARADGRTYTLHVLVDRYGIGLVRLTGDDPSRT